MLIEKAGIKNLDISPLMEGISGYLGRLDQTMDVLLPQMARMTTGVFRTAATVGIVTVLSAYILFDKEKLERQMKRLYRAYMPQDLYRPVKSMILTGIEVFENFVAGQGIESLILGSLCFAGMFILGLEYSGLAQSDCRIDGVYSNIGGIYRRWRGRSAFNVYFNEKSVTF